MKLLSRTSTCRGHMVPHVRWLLLSTLDMPAPPKLQIILPKSLVRKSNIRMSASRLYQLWTLIHQFLPLRSLNTAVAVQDPPAPSIYRPSIRQAHRPQVHGTGVCFALESSQSNILGKNFRSSISLPLLTDVVADTIQRYTTNGSLATYPAAPIKRLSVSGKTWIDIKRAVIHCCTLPSCTAALLTIACMVRRVRDPLHEKTTETAMFENIHS